MLDSVVEPSPSLESTLGLVLASQQANRKDQFLLPENCLSMCIRLPTMTAAMVSW
uniref:RGD1560755 protein n=1 Tax=Rattus norvegicus TaxID=10116 RepID=Q5M846_RAT|nr:RGD1560755 protein [Rattus norvegicus]